LSDDVDGDDGDDDDDDDADARDHQLEVCHLHETYVQNLTSSSVHTSIANIHTSMLHVST